MAGAGTGGILGGGAMGVVVGRLRMAGHGVMRHRGQGRERLGCALAAGVSERGPALHGQGNDQQPKNQMSAHERKRWGASQYSQGRIARSTAGHGHEAHELVRLLAEFVALWFFFDGAAQGRDDLVVAGADAQQRAELEFLLLTQAQIHGAVHG